MPGTLDIVVVVVGEKLRAVQRPFRMNTYCSLSPAPPPPSACMYLCYASSSSLLLLLTLIMVLAAAVFYVAIVVVSILSNNFSTSSLSLSLSLFWRCSTHDALLSAHRQTDGQTALSFNENEAASFHFCRPWLLSDVPPPPSFTASHASFMPAESFDFFKSGATKVF